MKTYPKTLVKIQNETDNQIVKAILRITSVTAIATIVLGLSPAIATAQTAVQGHGEVPNDPPFSDSQISVNAWLDPNGIAHGTVVWVGGTTHRRPGGPADPWLIDVTEITFEGNSTHVFGVVVHSVFPEEIGIGVPFDFTDNSGTGQADEMGVFGGDSFPIIAGNITVR